MFSNRALFFPCGEILDRKLLTLLAAVSLLGCCLCRPPVRQQHRPELRPVQDENTTDLTQNLEYGRYLKEVVQLLESDPEFRKKLETADQASINDGTIAHELDNVKHHVRVKLDEIKRQEVNRLQRLAERMREFDRGIDRNRIKVPHHLDFSSDGFQVQDLKKLMAATIKDLNEADKKRHDEFKRYEMEKKFEQQERLKHINDEAKRRAEEQRIKEVMEKHKKHERLNHPMSKDQLEEVWEKKDHLSKEDLNLRTFFNLHDLNGDGYLEESELKALFDVELDKAYDKKNPTEDDMVERMEEMERMREHVMKEVDTDKDRLISLQEFLSSSKDDNFENDPGWDTLDELGEEFSPDEFDRFRSQREAEIQALLDQGLVPPGYPYFGDLPPGAPPYIPGQPAYHVNQPVMPAGPGQPLPYPDQGVRRGIGGEAQNFQHGQPQQSQQGVRQEQHYQQPVQYRPAYQGAEPGQEQQRYSDGRGQPLQQQQQPPQQQQQQQLPEQQQSQEKQQPQQMQADKSQDINTLNSQQQNYRSGQADKPLSGNVEQDKVLQKTSSFQVPQP